MATTDCAGDNVTPSTRDQGVGCRSDDAPAER